MSELTEAQDSRADPTFLRTAARRAGTRTLIRKTGPPSAGGPRSRVNPNTACARSTPRAANLEVAPMQCRQAVDIPVSVHGRCKLTHKKRPAVSHARARCTHRLPPRTAWVDPPAACAAPAVPPLPTAGGEAADACAFAADPPPCPRLRSPPPELLAPLACPPAPPAPPDPFAGSGAGGVGSVEMSWQSA
jgi:hypothetical protein